MLFFVLRLSFSQVVGFLYYRNMFFRCESILGRKSPNVSKCHFFRSLPFILHSFPLMFLLYCIHLLSFCIRVLSFSLHFALIFHSCPSMFLLFAVPFILHLFPCKFLSFSFLFTFISFHVPSLCIKHTGFQKGIYSNRPKRSRVSHISLSFLLLLCYRFGGLCRLPSPGFMNMYRL